MTGREMYEADLFKQPKYHDGRPRPAWDRLPEFARQNWIRVAFREEIKS